MSQRDEQPTALPLRTTIEIVLLVLSIVAAVYFGRFGGPFDSWIRQQGFGGSQITVLIIVAWTALLFGIVSSRSVFRYALLACWILLATPMRVYQESHPVLNLAAALGVLVIVAALNRRKDRTHD